LIQGLKAVQFAGSGHFQDNAYRIPLAGNRVLLLLQVQDENVIDGVVRRCECHPLYNDTTACIDRIRSVYFDLRRPMNDHSLMLYLLGKPKIVLSGQLQPDLLVKAQGLLFYLALERRLHSRTSLAALLWSDMSEEKARANLRTAISRLRPLFSPYLTVSRSAIGLSDEADVWVDAIEFEKELSGSATMEKRSALDLYHGDLLTDF
jgi:hypothetical protein